jgi:hypothetical protein
VFEGGDKLMIMRDPTQLEEIIAAPSATKGSCKIEIRVQYLDSSLVRSELRWTPSYSFEQKTLKALPGFEMLI